MNNNMICDINTGVCGPATDNELEIINFSKPKEVIDVYYFTDPICSHCWALEPTLNRFLEQYGEDFNFHTIMGGLLKSWDGFADRANGISQFSDVAEHWREVGEHTRMPIDGSLWLDNPIHSSYPPSRVYKLVQKMNPELANVFLRKIREELFVFNKNIAEDKTLIEILTQLGLNGKEIVEESHTLDAENLLNEDFTFARKLGVRSFPTIIMMNKENKGVRLVGARRLEDYVDALKNILGENEVVNPKQVPSLKKYLNDKPLLFSKELEIMYDLDKEEVKSFVEEELNVNEYSLKEILGENYIQKK